MASPEPTDNVGPRARSGRPLPAAFVERIWQPGKSGNPGGKGGDYKRCLSLCREYSETAARRMAELAYLDARDDKGELIPIPINADRRTVLVASQWIYETAWGKPKEYDASKEADPNKPKFDPRLLTPQQLDIVEYALKLMVQATRAPGGVEIIDQPAAEDQADEYEDDTVDATEVEPDAVRG